MSSDNPPPTVMSSDNPPTVMSSDRRESRHLYNFLYIRMFIHQGTMKKITFIIIGMLAAAAAYAQAPKDSTVNIIAYWNAGEKYAVVVYVYTPGATHPMAIEYDSGDKFLDNIILDDGEGYTFPIYVENETGYLTWFDDDYKIIIMFKKLKKFLMEEDGVGVVEIILILVVLIGLVIVFKTQLSTLVTNIFSKITTDSNKIIK